MNEKEEKEKINKRIVLKKRAGNALNTIRIDDCGVNLKKIIKDLDKMTAEQIRKELPDATFRTMFLAVKVLEAILRGSDRNDRMKTARFLATKLGSKPFMDVLNSMADIRLKAESVNVEFKEE